MLHTNTLLKYLILTKNYNKTDAYLQVEYKNAKKLQWGRTHTNKIHKRIYTYIVKP